VGNGRKATLAYVFAYLILSLWTIGVILDWFFDKPPEPIFAVLMPVIAVWLFDVTIPGMAKRAQEDESRLE
jgi:hypothetical protein